MNYEIVTLEEKIVIGIAARINNLSPDMGAVIGGLWNRFYSQGIYASIADKANEKALGIYTDYYQEETNGAHSMKDLAAKIVQSDYTVLVACEVTKEPQGDIGKRTQPNQQDGCTILHIPAGRYAKFVIHGDMVQAVAAAWQEIWQLDLPRSFQCDFEEYQSDSMDQAEIHIYVGLAADEAASENKPLCNGAAEAELTPHAYPSQAGQMSGAQIESRCGILCNECKYREPMGCSGCTQIDKPFWGDSCPLKSCCEDKTHQHCGQCSNFPCDLLKQFAYDKEQGDEGKRIEQCKCWNAPHTM